MGFGLGKEQQDQGGKLSRKVFDDFDGVVVDARWRPSRSFSDGSEGGPSLELVIQNVIPNDNVQRVWYKLGKKFQGDVSEDGMLMSSEMQMNPNSGLAVFCNNLGDNGVDFSDERFNTEQGVNAAGFVGLKAHWNWEEVTTTIGNQETTYERLGVTKVYGFVDLDEFFTEQLKAEKNGSANLETAIELMKVYCMDTPRTHTDILAYIKKNAELAGDAEVIAKVKDANYLESVGLAKQGTKFRYTG